MAKWIAKSIKRPGAATRKAKRAGMSLGKWISKVTSSKSKASTLSKRQANEAKTLRKLARRRKSK